jgi:predicted metalloprotease with PDZ domain
MSGGLWLAEGFTQYYGALVLSRAGLVGRPGTAATLAGLVASVVVSPARTIRSAEDMSRMAAFTDGSDHIRPDEWPGTYISYYDFGGAIALALDLTLRDRSEGRLTLDDYMRACGACTANQAGGFRIRGSAIHTADAEARLADGERRSAICARLLRPL